MKRTITISAIILFVMAGCGGCKQSGTQSDDVIIVDVTASYPKKEIALQDFMDVEYIPLETSDDFLCQGFVLAVGKDIIVVKNFINDGNIFIFDRKGKSLKKINRKGQSGEEYIYALGITLDENNNELFINDHPAKKIIVYDWDGNFKRSLRHKEGTTYYTIYNFDQDNLICHDGFYSNDGIANRQSFMIISKQDGHISKEIQIPFEEKISTDLIVKDEASGMTWGASPSTYYPIIPYLDNWVIVEPSSDTIYRYLPDHSITPFIVRTPPVQSMNPEVFLFPGILTDHYYFMQTVKKEYDFETDSGFPSTDLMYDKKEKAIFRYTLYNNDYSNKKQESMTWGTINNEIATWQKLDAHQLVEAYEKGELKGKLKEIAAKLDEESNPVIMLVKHKK